MMLAQAMPAQHLPSSTYSPDPLVNTQPSRPSLSPCIRRSRGDSASRDSCCYSRYDTCHCSCRYNGHYSRNSTHCHSCYYSRYSSCRHGCHYSRYTTHHHDCNSYHAPDQCPAADGTCNNCGRKGHWARTSSCPAKEVQCRSFKKTGHYDRRCRAKKTDYGQKTSSCRCVTPGPASNAMIPKPVCIYLTHGGSTSHLQMPPDTGADVTVIGQRHLGMLQIPRSRLQPLPPVHTLTADGSEMAPALGCFQAILRLGQRSCVVRIQVHEGVQIPLLSYGQCKELAIISREFPKPIHKFTEITASGSCTRLLSNEKLGDKFEYDLKSSTINSERRVAIKQSCCDLLHEAINQID
ncbi:hypothetical protein O3P69_011974 [Scylla paramamosain]|uniref:Peptidase A2 domain-containing protein n=1 Tax=Scylla paramamosain TaxID=85552 RepID=A0AAW0SHE9_SCYPA